MFLVAADYLQFGKVLLLKIFVIVLKYFADLLWLFFLFYIHSFLYSRATFPSSCCLFSLSQWPGGPISCCCCCRSHHCCCPLPVFMCWWQQCLEPLQYEEDTLYHLVMKYLRQRDQYEVAANNMEESFTGHEVSPMVLFPVSHHLVSLGTSTCTSAWIEQNSLDKNQLPFISNSRYWGPLCEEVTSSDMHLPAQSIAVNVNNKGLPVTARIYCEVGVALFQTARIGNLLQYITSETASYASFIRLWCVCWRVEISTAARFTYWEATGATVAGVPPVQHQYLSCAYDNIIIMLIVNWASYELRTTLLK